MEERRQQSIAEAVISEAGERMGPQSWADDETLFSFCSRRHFLSNHLLHAQTTLDLFGHHRLGSAHDLPCRVDRFAARMDYALGDAESVIRHHTLLPYYLPLRTPEVADEAIRRMRGDSVGSIKYQLGQLTSRFRSHHPLKACSKCVIADRDRIGTAYWHLTQQLPGAWICLHHFEPLLLFCSKTDGDKRFYWHLPARALLISTSVGAWPYTLLERLASLAASFHRLDAHYYFSPSRLLNCYLKAATERGLTFDGTRLRLDQAGFDFAAFCKPLRCVPELRALPTDAAEARNQLGRLLRPPRTGTHPLRHLIVILWLFESWPSFLAAYNAAHPMSVIEAELAMTLETRKAAYRADHRTKLIKLILEGHSASAAARRCGIATETALTWAAEAHIPISRRPKVMSAAMRAEIVERLLGGASKRDVAQGMSLSIVTISRVLRSQPGLHDQLQQSVFRTQRNARRQLWLKLLQTSSSVGVKGLRLINPALYAWLYRNDREWLREKSPASLLVNGNHCSVRWDVRDTVFAGQIQRAAYSFVEKYPNKRLRRNDLLKLVPDLLPKLGRLSQLPLTAKAMIAALQLDQAGAVNLSPEADKSSSKISEQGAIFYK